ncbi:hypothetical protein [Corynebacterium crudilactis]|uniref:Uncharacterized protein n=1 Tax=Corynebacterium crudilactis TaxID=1652495 RepID=A0A172QS91_9CORY|nr:hypothetical protein [Corynebacterium crudilactis]ANE03520.1 hypothetical protein ccrud_04335 [Corynebacterium crudilactis]
MSRQRRRAFRASDAVDYDRTADQPVATSTNDESREVSLDPEQDDLPTGMEFWKEQQPPHHG